MAFGEERGKDLATGLESRFSKVAEDELRRQNITLSPSLEAELHEMIQYGESRLEQAHAGPDQLTEAEANLRKVVQTLASQAQRHAQQRGVKEYELEAAWIGNWRQGICPLFPWC